MNNLEPLSGVVDRLKTVGADYRDWRVHPRNLTFEAGPKDETQLRIPHAALSITRPALQRVCTHFKAPFSYLNKFPLPGELARHLTALAQAQEVIKTVRAVRQSEKLYLRGFMRGEQVPVDTWMILDFCRSLIEGLPGFGGVLLETAPKADGSVNRGRIVIPLAETFHQEPPLRATLEIENEECADLRVSLGCREALENGRSARLTSFTQTVHKQARFPFQILRKSLRAVRKMAKGAPTLKDIFEKGDRPFPMGLHEAARILIRTKAFPEGFGELLLTRSDDPARSTIEVFLTFCDAARDLPETLRRECEKKAWTLFTTGFRSVLAFQPKASVPTRTLQLVG